mgnify:CR=1 FL=1
MKKKPTFKNLTNLRSLVVGGKSYLDKSIFINSIVLSLLKKNNSKNIEFIIINPKNIGHHQRQPVLLAVSSSHQLGFTYQKTMMKFLWF